MKIILFIDGENFKKKIVEVLIQEGKITEDQTSQIKWNEYNFKGLLNKVLQGINIDVVNFYFGKISEHKDTLRKSRELIEKNRLLKKHLENFDYNMIIAGRVRGFIQNVNGSPFLSFKEKGVDVRIAVDLITLACDKELETAIIGSSDSDLQPAIREIVKRGTNCIYLGFENNPNKGISYTTDRTILIRNSEVLEFLSPTLI
jgi:uncharacterized LabA/DUF88 family protein